MASQGVCVGFKRGFGRIRVQMREIKRGERGWKVGYFAGVPGEKIGLSEHNVFTIREAWGMEKVE